MASCFSATFAQQPDTAKQEKIAALKQSLTKNQAAVKQYAWTEATHISLNGEVKKREQKQCQYGPTVRYRKHQSKEPILPNKSRKAEVASIDASAFRFASIRMRL